MGDVADWAKRRGDRGSALNESVGAGRTLLYVRHGTVEGIQVAYKPIGGEFTYIVVSKEKAIQLAYDLLGAALSR